MAGPDGEDQIISDIRNTIQDELNGDNYYNAFFNILLYMILLCFTVSYGAQYLKRVVYVAFLTLVSPLIALTYPLDKIKDGKAQAFEVWLKEFMFNVLLQIIHLLLYYLLITSAGDLATNNKVYALVAIGALLPAEKFFRKLFGLESSTSMGNMASALGGAAIMNSINKLGSKKIKGKAEKQKDGAGDNTKIRTAKTGGEDPYDVLKGTSSATIGQNTANPLENEGSNSSLPVDNTKRNIKSRPSFGDGAWNVARKYVLNKNTGKSILRGAGKIAGAATLGTIGLAAGIATGEVENAFAGAAGGIAAGRRVGGNLVDGGSNLLSGVAGGLRGIKDTFQEGQYGEEAYAKMKQKEEFRKSAEYSKLTSKYPGQEGNIEEFLNAGITDASRMGTAMKNIKDGRYNVEEAIQYMKMADKCPEGILYDDEKFRKYLSLREIPESQAEQIRKGIVDFK